MKSTISKDRFNELQNEELFQLLVRPIAAEMHSGKGKEHKFTVYKKLTEGQRAAFMFWVLYSHAEDTAQLYTWIPYMRQPEPGYWEQLKKGMKLLRCTQVLLFLEKCDVFFSAQELKKSGWASFISTDLKDPALKKQVEMLYNEWKEIAGQAMCCIGGYIKDHIQDFAVLTGSLSSEGSLF